MTDAEIIKALECCLDTSPLSCKKCPLFNATNSTMVCSKIATKIAIDLINRQKEKIERLRAESGNQSTLWSQHYESLFETAKETIKVEAIKEFVERLKTDYGEFVYLGDIDHLVKEMEGDMK